MYVVSDNYVPASQRKKLAQEKKASQAAASAVRDSYTAPFWKKKKKKNCFVLIDFKL